MSNCTSGCPTQDHESWGACMRSKNVVTTGLESTHPSFTRKAEKAWNYELDAYAAARAQGIQPASTKLADTQAAVEASNILGQAYNADSPPAISIAGE